MTIPNSVTSIGDSAFDNCGSLTSLMIPASVTTIGHLAFAGSGLTSVTIPPSVTSIGDHAFNSCFGLTTIDVIASNPSYASVSGVLFNKTLTTLILYPEGRTGGYVIPASVTSIGDGAFEICGLKSVKIPDGVTRIGDYEFSGCFSLMSVTIPASVTTIGYDAFQQCSALTSVTIPASVTTIGVYAFSSCTSLGQAFFQGNAPSVNGGAGSADSTVFAYAGTRKAYYVPGTTGWGATFGGWPTAQSYQPQPQILGAGHGLAAGSPGFQFTISWATNQSVVVEASTDLQNWTPTSTNTLVNGASAIVDSTWTDYPQRFYRLRVAASCVPSGFLRYGVKYSGVAPYHEGLLAGHKRASRVATLRREAA